MGPSSITAASFVLLQLWLSVFPLETPDFKGLEASYKKSLWAKKKPWQTWSQCGSKKLKFKRDYFTLSCNSNYFMDFLLNEGFQALYILWWPALRKSECPVSLNRNNTCCPIKNNRSESPERLKTRPPS